MKLASFMLSGTEPVSMDLFMLLVNPLILGSKKRLYLNKPTAKSLVCLSTYDLLLPPDI